MIKLECKKCGKRVYTGTIKIENGEQIFVCSHCEEKEESLRAEQQPVYPTLTETNQGLEAYMMQKKMHELETQLKIHELETQKKMQKLEQELRWIKLPTEPQHPWSTPIAPTYVPISTPINLQQDGSLRNM